MYQPSPTATVAPAAGRPPIAARAPTQPATSPTSRAGVFPWIASLFTLKPEQFHPIIGIVAALIVVGLQLVLKAVGHQELALSFTFGVLFTALSDLAVRTAPYVVRLRWSGAVVLVGTLLTALGYLLGGASWILVALAVFVSTLLSMLAAAYGKRGATAGVLLNVWFVIALSVSASLDKSPAQTWPLVGPQALAWLAGGVLWLVVAGLLRLLRQAQRSAPATPAQAMARAHWSHAVVAFAWLAAVAVALATAVAWGFDLPNADWMVASAIVAMKPSFQASVTIGGQRIAGAILGGLLAALLLSSVHDRFLLEVVIVLLMALGTAIHEVNYALYYTAISAAVLTSLGLPHPGSWTDIWQRMGWTLAGVAIALAVMLIAAGLASQRGPQSAATPVVAAGAAPQGSSSRPPSASERAQRQVALARGRATLATAFAQTFPMQVADYHAQLHSTMDRALHLSGALDLLRAAASLLEVPSQPQASEYIETDLTTWEVRPGTGADPDGRRLSSAWSVQEEERHTTHFRGYALEIPGTTPFAICVGYLIERVAVFALHTQAELDRVVNAEPCSALFQCDLPVIRSLDRYLYVPLYEVEILQRGNTTSRFPDPRHRSARLLHVQHDKHVITGRNVLDMHHFLVTVDLTAGTSALLSVADLPHSLREVQQELTPTTLATIQEHLSAQLAAVLHHIRGYHPFAEPLPPGQGQRDLHPMVGTNSPSKHLGGGWS